MDYCSAVTGKNLRCRNQGNFPLGPYRSCRISGHMQQVYDRMQKEALANPRSPPPPDRPLPPGVSPLVPAEIILPPAPVMQERNRRESTRVIWNCNKPYRVIKILGRGAYGEVSEVVDENGNTFAIKQQEGFDTFNGFSIPSLVEADILTRFSHPNLVKAHEIFIDPATTWISYVMSKEDYQLSTLSKLPLRDLKDVLFQLVSAVAFLHDGFVIHADLKPENILISERNDGGYNLKVADFGLCQYDVYQPKSLDVQTYWYRSPEVFAHNRYYGRAIDMWSIGIIMRRLITGNPFSQVNESKYLKTILELMGVDYELNRVSLQQLQLITGKKIINRLQLIRSLSLSQRLKLCNQPDMGLTLTHSDYLRNFGRDGVEYLRLMNACLHLDPSKRITASEFLESPFFGGKEALCGRITILDTSFPRNTSREIYQILADIIGKDPYHNQNSLILAYELLDRVIDTDINLSDLELGLGCLSLGLKLNQRCSIPINVFRTYLDDPGYTKGQLWQLEARIAQELGFVLYIENLPVFACGYRPDQIWTVYSKALELGENTYQLDHLLRKLSTTLK